MTAVAVIVRDALRHLKVQDPRQPVKAEDARDAIRALNLMMRRWEADGLALGWSDVATMDDELPAPPEAEEAIGFNLAIKLRPGFGVTLDADVVANAQSGLSSLTADVLSNQFVRTSYPDLPVGESQVCGDWREGYTR